MAAIEPKPSAAAPHLTLKEFLAQQREIDLLRFITCGSVDDGKSTLIGRLLHDTRQVFDDQLSAVANDSRRWGTTGEVPDLALLVDGLQAEREQGITIDVAYRYFQTPKRKFIVADCPGHEQYTRNMATGASTAEAAVVLVDAEKGIRVQTRRHAHIVALLGVQNIILAVNKMDRIAYDRTKYEAITAEFIAYAQKLGVSNVEVIPVGALHGVNVVHRGTKETPWYTGRTLLEALEGIEVGRNEGLKELRFPDPAREPSGRELPRLRRHDRERRDFRRRHRSGAAVAQDQQGARDHHGRRAAQDRRPRPGRDGRARRRDRPVARRRAGASRSPPDTGAHVRCAHCCGWAKRRCCRANATNSRSARVT
jgi:sulfate adenylyltransferase subunit 1 (EFTu-like GTPase family)